MRLTVSVAKALREILVDELHSHLYLKSFWCETRWAAYTVNQQTSMLCDAFGFIEFTSQL